MKQLKQNYSPFQIIKYIFTPFDSRCSTVWTTYKILDIKYGMFKAFFWILITLTTILIAGKLE